MQLKKFLLLVLASIQIILLFNLVKVNPAHAQFTGDYGAIKGSVRWGTYNATGAHLIEISNDTGFRRVIRLTNPDVFDTDFVLPPGIYSITASIFPSGGQGFVIETKTVEVFPSRLSLHLSLDMEKGEVYTSPREI